MARLTLMLSWLLIACSSVQACVWVPGTTQEGKRKSVSLMKASRMLDSARQTLAANRGADLLSQFEGATNFEDRISYGAGLIYAGKYQEAIALLQNLEREQPGVYYTAANLGTAYELDGATAEALHWIQEGVKRDPDSHDGTEWVHVKILQAKLAAEKDRNYFSQHTILDLVPPIHPAQGGTISVHNSLFPAEKVRKSLLYQLQERLLFVNRIR